MTSVVTGANRGIGLEFARQLAARGGEVIGTARDPSKARELRGSGASVEELDVSSEKSVEDFGRRLGGRAIDLLVNNAGIGEESVDVERVSADELERYFRTNATGPFRLAQSLLPNLRAGRRKLVVSLSSGLGSIEGNREGGWVAYRASKAALNQLMRTFAAELSGERMIFVLLSPGWVRTRMGGPGATLTPEESVRAMLKIVDGLTTRDNGKFYDHKGREVAW
jgi:NAD(P)-dependent dehydrogenase (short-subunit alcohol dehydrogenase family)